MMNVTAPDSYRFVVCDNDKVLGHSHAGFSRTAIDPPMKAALLEDRLNIASMSKTLTAAAVLSTLQAKNLSVDTLVAEFLPASWVLHPLVQTLTFRDFLTHRTGFNESTDRSDYEGIKLSFQQGPPNPAKALYEYRNINFAAFRIILPYLNAYDRFAKLVSLHVPSTAQIDQFLAKTYVNIVNERVLRPSGLPFATCDSKTLAPASNPSGRPVPKSSYLPVLMYEYKNPAFHGVDLGDSTLICGAGGWSLSVVDYAKFLQTLLFTEIIISEKYRALMLAGEPLKNEGLGMNKDMSLAGTEVYSHGAWIPVGNAQVAGWYLYFKNTNLIVVALSNAGHNPTQPNWYTSVLNAYVQTYSN